MDKAREFEFGLCSHAGMQRPHNEDRAGVPPDDLAPEVLQRKGTVFIVADGVGGQLAGEKASETAVQTILSRYYADPSADVGKNRLICAHGELVEGSIDA